MPDSLESLGSPLRDLNKVFEEMATPVRPALWRYCYRLTGSAWDAEDLVQETLIKAFARLAKLWQPLEPKSYLFRIATNTWIDTMRKSRVPLEDIEEMEEVHTDGDEETWETMEVMVSVLPPRQRVVVLLSSVFDFTNKEIAAMLQTTEGSVKSLLHRARATLTKIAENEGETTSQSNIGGRAHHLLVDKYVEAFNRRDPEAICALLSDDVTVDIVGAGVEYGLKYVRKYSLTDWAADPQPMSAVPGILEGDPVMYVFYHDEQGERSLAWIMRFTITDAQICGIRNYVFCPELIRHAADQLGLPSHLLGYRYIPISEQSEA